MDGMIKCLLNGIILIIVNDELKRRGRLKIKIKSEKFNVLN